MRFFPSLICLMICPRIDRFKDINEVIENENL